MVILMGMQKDAAVANGQVEQKKTVAKPTKKRKVGSQWAMCWIARYCMVAHISVTNAKQEKTKFKFWAMHVLCIAGHPIYAVGTDPLCVNHNSEGQHPIE